MQCRIDDLRNRQVVCVNDGSVLGYISDIEFDTENGNLTALVIYGRPRALGFLGHESDVLIPWKDIEVIGPETVLVSSEAIHYINNGKIKR